MTFWNKAMAFWRKPSDAVDRPPWEQGSPILQRIRDWNGSQPLELPDEEPASVDKVRFASGAWDGILTTHMGASGEHEEAKFVHDVLNALITLVRSDDERSRRDLYRLSLDQSIVPYADAFIEELSRQREFGPESLRVHARWLVHTATHREPLKLGVLLLGLSGTAEDIDDLITISRHDEFTLFAAIAVANILDDPTDAWWAMARSVHGWGKVHLVERLCGRVEDRPDIRDWLVRHGCNNEIMPEYLACCCARAGHMAEALDADDPDEEWLDGACLIFRALLNGGPAEDIDSYEDGVDVATSLIDHLTTRCESLNRLEVVAALHDWLEVPESREPSPAPVLSEGGDQNDRWARREALGWTTWTRMELAARCRDILGRVEWRERVVLGYSSNDNYQRSLAWSLAPRVGVDLWEAGYERLKTDPLDSHLYWDLMRTEDRDRLRRVIAFAETNLPLGEIASGPSTALGLGPAYRAHGCLDFIVQEMRREGVFSALLVATALRSPVVRNRNMALAALENHPFEEWGPSLTEALRRAASAEPDEQIRERMRAVAGRTG